MGERATEFLWDSLARWKVCGWLVLGAVMGLVREMEKQGATFLLPSSTLFSFTYLRWDRSGGYALSYFRPLSLSLLVPFPREAEGEICSNRHLVLKI